MSTPVCIALTGGIASGKSATAKRFADLGVSVFDADAAARAVVAPGQPALLEIADAFGRSLINEQGALDRARMRDVVFSDAPARHRLEQILHPRIHAVLRSQVEACTSKYCVLAIPLLVETLDSYAWARRILVTDVPTDMQLQRLANRPGIDHALAQRILDAQATRAQRLAIADDVIDNTGPIEVLARIVARLHRRYMAMASDCGHAARAN